MKPILTEDIEDAALLMLAGHDYDTTRQLTGSTSTTIKIQFELSRESNDRFRREMKSRTMADVIAEIYKFIHEDIPQASSAVEFELYNGFQKYFISSFIGRALSGEKLVRQYFSSAP